MNKHNLIRKPSFNCYTLSSFPIMRTSHKTIQILNFSPKNNKIFFSNFQKITARNNFFFQLIFALQWCSFDSHFQTKNVCVKQLPSYTTTTRYYTYNVYVTYTMLVAIFFWQKKKKKKVVVVSRHRYGVVA